MSICSYNKSTKQSAPTTPPNNPTKSSKDERPYTNFPQRGPSKRQFHDGKKSQANPRNYRQKTVGQKRDQKFERYAPGSSYVKADGNVKETSKKVSLNHLLNFKFEPRENENAFAATRPKFKHGYKRNASVSAFSKERFLQANCQFVVSENGDYSIHYIDPDAPVPWEKVEQLTIKVDNELSCPICLCPPSAAKITKCGHVYCWSCILHYLALDEKGRDVRECPICCVDVRKSDLRSVAVYERIPLCIGAVVEMKLMFRKAGSLIPHHITEIEKPVAVSDSEAKISVFSPFEVLDLVIEPELGELKRKLAESLEDLEREFVNTAVKECEKRKADLLQDISQKCENVMSIDEVEEGGSKSSENNSSDVLLADENTSKNAIRSEVFHYFYQSANGESVFLNGVNVKCLLKEYGDFAKSPATINANLVHFESFVMTEELRKRHKYLSHLPLSCEYKIVELDLKAPLVSEQTLEQFKGHIQRRAKTRQKKERKENDSQKRAEFEEQQKLKKYLRENSHRSSASAFAARSAPAGSVSVFVTGNGPNVPWNESGYDSVSASSSEYSVSPTSMPYSSSAPMSFAAMLRTGEMAVPKPRPRQPQVLGAPASHEIISKKSEDDDDPEDPYYVAPTYQSSFGDALSMALDGLTFSANGVDAKVENTQVTKGNRRQKKKKKQTLLFSTSAQIHP